MRLTRLACVIALAACHSSTTAPAPTGPAQVAPATAFKPTSFSVEVSGSGRPVIFIPGLACDGHVWDSTIAHLGGKVQAHVLTLAGFGGKPAIDKPLLPTVRDEIIEYIRANHLEKPILVGHSLGGFMTYWVAEAAPDLVAAGIAVDGAPFFAALINPNATAESAAAMAKAMREQMVGSPDKFRDGVVQFMNGAMREPAKHQDLVETSAKSDPTATADAMAFLTQTDLRGDLPKIKAPILTIVADSDGQMPRPMIEATWKAQLAPIPAHDIIVIEHSKHFVMVDQPDAFFSAIDAFLAKH
jgi:pimeloyl-ACP methyl ester carboxylesterase